MSRNWSSNRLSDSRRPVWSKAYVSPVCPARATLRMRVNSRSGLDAEPQPRHHGRSVAADRGDGEHGGHAGPILAVAVVQRG